MLVQAKKKCLPCKDHLGAGQVPEGLTFLLREANFLLLPSQLFSFILLVTGGQRTRCPKQLRVQVWELDSNPDSTFNQVTAALYLSFLYFLFFIGVLLINNVVLVSSVQQSDSVIHIHGSSLIQIIFPFRLLHNTEQSSLCYTVALLVIYFKY